MPEDKHVEIVITKLYERLWGDEETFIALSSKFRERAIHGFNKYGVTTERLDLTTNNWLNHLIEELMDTCVYAQVLLNEYNEKFLTAQERTSIILLANSAMSNLILMEKLRGKLK